MKSMTGVLAFSWLNGLELLGTETVEDAIKELSIENVYDLGTTFGNCLTVKIFLLDISVPVSNLILDGY